MNRRTDFEWIGCELCYIKRAPRTGDNEPIDNLQLAHSDRTLDTWFPHDHVRIECYALILTSLALSADPAERRTALQHAREHGLDVLHVAIVTAECTIECPYDVSNARKDEPII